MTDRAPFLQRPGPELRDAFPVPDAAAWEAAALKAARGVPLAALGVWAPAGEPLPPMVRGPIAERGAPGHAPFVRGWRLDEKAYGWDVRATLEAGSPEEAGAVLKHDLDTGAFSHRVRLAPSAQGLSGAGLGIPVHSLADVRALYAHVDLEQHPVDLDVGVALGAWLGAFHALGAIDSDVPLRGVLAADPIGAWIEQDERPAHPSAIYGALAEAVTWLGDRAPNLSLFGFDGASWTLRGAEHHVELGLLLAQVVDLCRQLEDHGVTPDQVVPRITVRMQLGSRVLHEVSRLRAWRALWAQVVEHMGCEGQPGRVHGVSSVAQYTARDPWNNMLRGTMGLMAGALGGADAVTVVPFDAPLGTPSAHARRVARLAQHVVLWEGGLAAQVDPAGGSHVVEALTDRFMAGAWEVFQRVEAMGGITEALASGQLGELLAEQQAEQRQRVLALEVPQVGVSAYAALGQEQPSGAPRTLQRGAQAFGGLTDPGALAERLRAGGSLSEGFVAVGERLPLGLPPALRASVPWEHLQGAADALPERPVVQLKALGSVRSVRALREGLERGLALGGLGVTDGPSDAMVLLVGDAEPAVVREALAAHGTAHVALSSPVDGVEAPVYAVGAQWFDVLRTLHRVLGVNP